MTTFEEDIAAVRAVAIHYVDGDFVTGPSNIHWKSCPGCKQNAALDRIANRPSKEEIQHQVEWWITDSAYKPPELLTNAYWRMMAREIAEYAVGEIS